MPNSDQCALRHGLCLHTVQFNLLDVSLGGSSPSTVSSQLGAMSTPAVILKAPAAWTDWLGEQTETDEPFPSLTPPSFPCNMAFLPSSSALISAEPPS